MTKWKGTLTKNQRKEDSIPRLQTTTSIYSPTMVYLELSKSS